MALRKTASQLLGARYELRANFAQVRELKPRPDTGYRPLAYSVQRRNRRAPLVPPNPKELDMAYSTLALRASFGM